MHKVVSSQQTITSGRGEDDLNADSDQTPSTTRRFSEIVINSGAKNSLVHLQRKNTQQSASSVKRVSLNSTSNANASKNSQR